MQIVFCKIIEAIPSNTIYEDDEFKVILDASPASKGHALILPKEHYADIYEIDGKTAGHAMHGKNSAKHDGCQSAMDLILCRIIMKLLDRQYFIFTCI